MKPTIRPAVLAVLALAVLASSASAAPTLYTIDPSHTEVGFKIRHFFSRVSGQFNQFAGTIQYDDKDLAASSVDMTIQTASISTNNERRDNHLRSDDFFAADKNPTITFKSTKVIPGESGKFKIQGDLTMRGVTKPVTLDAELLGVGPIEMSGPNGKMTMTRAGFTAGATINRKDWGINWNKVLDNGGTMLDDNVALEFNVEAVKGEMKMPAPKTTSANAPATAPATAPTASADKAPAFDKK